MAIYICLSLDLQMLIVMATWIIMEQDLLKVCVVCLHTSVCVCVCVCVCGAYFVSKIEVFNVAGKHKCNQQT